MSAITEAEQCRNTLALYSLMVSNNGVKADTQTQTQTHREPSREAARVIFTLRSGIKAARGEPPYFLPLFKRNRNLSQKKPPIMWNCEISICCWLLVMLGELLGFHNNLKCRDRRRRETSARIWDLHHQLQNCTSPLDWSPGRGRSYPLSGLHHCTAVTVALLVSEYRPSNIRKRKQPSSIPSELQAAVWREAVASRQWHSAEFNAMKVKVTEKGGYSKVQTKWEQLEILSWLRLIRKEVSCSSH